MRRFLRSLATRVVAVAVVLTLCGLALAQAGARVAGIEFKGNKTISSDTLRLSLRTKVGQPLDESQLNEDVKTLYDLFSSVQVEKTQQGDQVSITFVVVESAIAKDVVLKGVSGLSESDVRAVMDSTRGRPVADFRVENDARKIERLYKLKGYHFVEVKTETADQDGGKAVTFNVLEGPKVQVEKITFKGAEHVNRSKLLDVMATKETGFLGLRGADFVEENLVKDRNAIALYYRYEGFLNRQVRIGDVSFSDDRRKAFVTIEIDEGAPFMTSKVAIVGADSYPGGADALKPLLKVQAGTRFRGEDVNKSLNALEAAYHQEGFYSADVFEEEHPVGDTVDVTFHVDEQSKVRVRDVVIVGNSITQDKVIRREAPGLLPGEVLNQNEIRKTQDRLKSLGYFTDVKVDVAKAKQGDDPNQRDVRIEVDDTAKTGQVKFAIGASSDLGLLGSFTITKRNFDWQDWPEHFSDVFSGRAFTGAGETFQLELSPGQNFSNYRLAYTEPWLFDKPIEFGWDLFFSKFSRFDYDVDRSGLDVTLGRRFTYPTKQGDDLVLGVSGTTRIEGVDLSNLDHKSAPTAFLAKGNDSLISERVALRVDRLDNALDPRKGWFAQYTPEVGFGGDIRLFKQELEARDYWTLWTTEDERPHTLSIGSHLGYVTPLGSSTKADPNAFDTKFVPTYEQFFVGGTSTIRGFAFGGAGPHGRGSPMLDRTASGSFKNPVRLGETIKSVLDNDGDPLGGNVMFLANVEYGIPLYEDLLRGVVFVDTGLVRYSTSSSHGLDHSVVDQVRGQLSGLSGKRAKNLARSLEFDDGGGFFQDLRVAAGFGFRIKIPGLGQTPIALDFGFPVKKRSGDDTQILSFSIAQNF